VKTYYASLSKLELPCATKSDVIVVEHGVVRVRVVMVWFCQCLRFEGGGSLWVCWFTQFRMLRGAFVWILCFHDGSHDGFVHSLCFQPPVRTCRPRWTCLTWAPGTRCSGTLTPRRCTSMSHRCLRESRRCFSEPHCQPQ
jgi:hypothetical protein